MRLPLLSLIMLFSVMVSCSEEPGQTNASASNETVSTEPVKQGSKWKFNPEITFELRSIENSIINFNDLQKKAINEEPYHAFADILDQALGAAVARYQAEVHLRLPEFCLFPGNTQVAGHGKFTTSPQSKAVDRCHNGFGKTFDQEKNILSALRKCRALRRIQSAEFGNVRTGHEGFFACAGEHHAFQSGDVPAFVAKESAQFKHGLGVQGVQRLFPADGDDGDAVRNLDLQILV